MRFSLLLFLCLVISSCFSPTQTVWQRDVVRQLNARDSTPPSNPRMKSAPSKDIGEMPNKPGACYGKSMMPASVSKDVLGILPLYTKDTKVDDVQLDTIFFEMQAASTEWIKKVSMNNCQSDDPNDCLVWCLVEVPAQYEKFVVVKDTSQTKHFKMTEIVNEVEYEAGALKWVEVICEPKITEKLLKDVQGFLYIENYLTGNITGKMGNETKYALKKYQEENNLPIGQLDFKTLDKMGVAY